ncbi:MAG: bifunctional riboflavin kinase/FAD synthetase [Alphaproteobacteria bacterium]|jgi:riboflavin kinase/FMN adenylyltransferase|nr:riboflavin biosynthesis protein RibF [Rhodospirillaceae bacterium]MDP6403981.1 bifunctional riboflavin kinase/FAD synthetase [Alphaproteobacteria bacterium]MDP6620809.1 bifunctional riboflavin kinase/FAD synthetase [Alphaproteobacteria bacterium]
MRIFRHFEDLPAEFRGAVVAIGNFDGLHRGHLQVLGRTARLAEAAGTKHGVVTFEPHPRHLFQPDAPPFRLTPFRVKATEIERQNVDFLLALHFDAAFAALEAEAFVERVLIAGLGVHHIVVGYDFVFGRGRRGDAALLRRRGEETGFGVDVVGPVGHGDAAAGGEIYASSRIREYLHGAQPMPAAERLGRWWEVDGRVREGERRGRQIGFATANLKLEEYLQPAIGVYAVRMLIEDDAGGWRPGVANLGNRPTFGNGELLLEVHLFDFDADIYGRHVRVAFIEHLRAEKKFAGIDELKAQIAKDSDAARSLLADPAYAQDRFSA